MGEQNDIKKLKGFIRRRRKAFIFAFLLIFLSAVAVAFILPSIYQSETKILIEGQQIPQDYVKSAITSYVEERLQVITQQVMTRNKLLDIINQFNLYPEMKDRNTVEDIIVKMRKDINLKTISANVIDPRTGRPTAATIAFTLSYEGKDPSTVQKVANVLASLYLEEELKTREKLASSTTVFLQGELNNLKEQILFHENKISKFKEAHIGELPEFNRMNLDSIARLERELDSGDMRLRSLEDRLIYLRGQIANVDPLLPVVTAEGKMAMNPAERLKGLRLKLLSLQSTLSEKHPDIKNLKREIEELEAQVGESDDAVLKIKRLNESENQLAVLKSRLGAKHPDVIRLTKEVETLSQEVDELSTEKARLEVGENKPDNPAYINLMTQIVSTQLEIKGLIQDRQKIKQKLDEYRSKIEATPIVEKEYNELTRDYENAKRKYNEIMNRLQEATVSQGMEESQRGERFTITEPAYLPEKPYKPNRIAIILLGFVLAFGTSIGFSAIRENLDHSVKSSFELKNITGIPVFSVIPYTLTDKEIRKRKMKRMFLVSAIMVTIVVALLLINNYLIPLDILWLKMQRKLMMMA